MLTRVDEKLRTVSSHVLHLLEATLYSLSGFLLAGAALALLVDAGHILWEGMVRHTLANYGLEEIEQLLLVLVLVEILHTVRISLTSKAVIIEPFLIVGLIASVRRLLVIAMQAGKLKEAGPEAPVLFQQSMIELGVVGFLIITFVVAIYVLRRAFQHEILTKEYEN